MAVFSVRAGISVGVHGTALYPFVSSAGQAAALLPAADVGRLGGDVGACGGAAARTQTSSGDGRDVDARRGAGAPRSEQAAS